ncbi:TPA: DNA damage-inducible protein I [Klebsiella oxytoca]|uniref:DNA damage-inducible protein I n=1 Tax=Klebsiella TaxID=570 RepID=UPI001CCBADE2|nr:DNA damage-inducible protein I [Klebsiella oxytoca]MBZ7655641.1 DNA damage-inducible protein I [Klebsiella oxytoca]MDS7772321.1 DNA damage-inducible protein I [Klebsiella oxytoca]HCM6214469.1 DNA damage-inducible protein I [Klebsiella oxytoca]
MRIEVSIAKSTALPNGALDALNNELSRRIEQQFPSTSSQVTVRYAANNNLSVIGGLKEDKDRISEILQETRESADDWFVRD